MKNPLTYLSRTWERERARWAKTTMRVCGKGVAARIARQKAPVIKENAKYSFVELGKLNTSLYTRRILKRFWRLHRCTTMLHKLIELWTLSVPRPPIPPTTAGPDSDFIQSQKRALREPDPLLCSALHHTYCTVKAVAACHKNSIHCFKPFPTARILHGISTVVRFNNFRRLTLFAVLPKPMPLKRLKLVLKSR